MKVLVLALGRTTPDRLLDDDRLGSVRLLMDVGLYGRLIDDGPVDWSALGERFAQGGATAPEPARSFDEARDLLDRGQPDLLVVLDDGPDDPRAFDDGVRDLLERIDGATAVLIACRAGAFVLAGPSVPPLGEVMGTQADDLAPTLLALAGLAIPASLPGRPLVDPEDVPHSLAPASLADDEAAVRERLSGLGYI